MSKRVSREFNCWLLSWSARQSLPGLDCTHQPGAIIAMPSHCDVFVSEAARAMRGPVHIDGADPLRILILAPPQDSMPLPFSFFRRHGLTTVMVGWCFFAALSEAMRLTKD